MKSKIKCNNIGIENMCQMLENPLTPKIKLILTQTENGKIIGTCALGEIAYQLKIKYDTLFDILDHLVKIGIPRRLFKPKHKDDPNLYRFIVNLNDYTGLTKPQIAQEIREKFGDVQ